MNPQGSDSLHFDLQLGYARPVIALLAALSLLELGAASTMRRPLWLLAVYLGLAIVILLLERLLRRFHWHVPLACDVLVVGAFLFLSPEVLPAWFLIFFVAFAAGYRWNLRLSLFLCFGLLLLAMALEMHRADEAGQVHHLVYSLYFFGATFLAAAGMAFLGDRNRRFAGQQAFLGRLATTMHVELGLAESLRLLLEEFAQEFQTDEVLLAFRDTDLERIFIWRLKSGESERLIPDSIPLTRADGFLLDDKDASLCWNALVGRGIGFGWDRRDGQALKSIPRVPGPTQQELGIKNLMTVAFDQDELPAGRIFLVNRKPARVPFTKDDLAWF